MMRRQWVERTISVKFPPQVEFKRLGNRKALSFTSSIRGLAITPQTCAFFPNAIRSGKTLKCSQHQLRPVAPMPHCTSSKISRMSFSSEIFRSFCSHSPRKWLSPPSPWRSEEHTSELQSQSNLVCRLLLEKKKYK